MGFRHYPRQCLSPLFFSRHFPPKLSPQTFCLGSFFLSFFLRIKKFPITFWMLARVARVSNQKKRASEEAQLNCHNLVRVKITLVNSDINLFSLFCQGCRLNILRFGFGSAQDVDLSSHRVQLIVTNFAQKGGSSSAMKSSYMPLGFISL